MINRLVAARADERADRALWAMNRGDIDRAFSSARRHSRRIRRLRVLVPAVTVIFVLALTAWVWLDPLGKLPIKAANVMVTGSKITMQAPRLTGFSRDARPYELVAKSASQDISRPDVMELREIHAKMKMPQDGTAEMSALDGTYDSKKEILTLGQDVILISSSGYKVWLTDAVIDVRKTHVVTDKPVKVEMLQGVLNAQRLEVSDAGALMVFDGGVKMVMQMGAGTQQAGQRATPSGATPANAGGAAR